MHRRIRPFLEVFHRWFDPADMRNLVSVLAAACVISLASVAGCGADGSCVRRSDCAADTVCMKGMCRATCANDLGCPGGQGCDGQGRCDPDTDRNAAASPASTPDRAPADDGAAAAAGEGDPAEPAAAEPEPEAAGGEGEGEG